MRRSLKSKNILHLVVTIASLVLFSGSATVSAQPTQALSEDWRTADFSLTSSMMAADPIGNIYVVGNNLSYNLVIKKFSPVGVLLWQTTYDDPLVNLRGVWIVADGNGNAVVQANMVNASTGNSYGWITVKYDTNGNLLWFKSASGMVAGSVRVGVDTNNNVYVAGSALFDSVLIKYSPSGTTLWTKVFDNNGAFDTPASMVISPDGSRIGVAGSSGYTLMALMYDPNGNLLWSNTNSDVGPASDLAFGPGNVSYFGASTNFPYPNPNQMAIAKFDAAGNQIYVKGYSVGDRTYFVRVDGQGNVVATGIDIPGYMDWMTIKTDANGNLLWSQRYDGGRNNDEYPLMLMIDASDSVYVTGRGGPNPGSGNVSYLKGVVAKYNSDGTPQWAVWDDYAGGRAIVLGAGNTLASLGYNYLVVAHYTQTGLPDLPPAAAPTNLSARADLSLIDLSFVDNASNEFWVDVERCTGSGCTNFSKVGQTRGENATTFRDTNISRGVTYTYRMRAVGFMGASAYSNTLEVSEPPLNAPAAPSNLTAAMSGVNVVLNYQDNSTNESLFVLERCQGAGCTNFAWLDARSTDITTLTDYNAAAGQSYSYRVRAWNSDGYSDYSNTAAIVTTGAAVSLQSLTLNPTQVSGGSPSTGTVAVSGAVPSGSGLVVALASSNPSVAGVPLSVTVPQGATSASFTITTTPVSVSTTVNISATYAGLTKSATLTVLPQVSADTVAITLAQYRRATKQLSVQATSTSTTATLKAYVTATGKLIGTLVNNGGGRYSGQFSQPSNPQNITVRSSRGGSANKAVTTR